MNKFKEAIEKEQYDSMKEFISDESIKKIADIDGKCFINVVWFINNNTTKEAVSNIRYTKQEIEYLAARMGVTQLVTENKRPVAIIYGKTREDIKLDNISDNCHVYIPNKLVFQTWFKRYIGSSQISKKQLKENLYKSKKDLCSVLMCDEDSLSKVIESNYESPMLKKE